MTRRTFSQLAAVGIAAAADNAPDRANDPQRPQFHFLAPRNWMNDPNGPIYHQGTYHMFYQWGPDDPQAKPAFRCWGHATSTDMIHWKHRPAAIPIEPGSKSGVWSGSVVIDGDVPTAIFTGGGGQDIATSQAPDAASMMTWKRYEGNPVLKSPPPGMQLSGWRDPCVWKEADGWSMLLGAGYKGVAGTALLYRSTDLRHWDYLHPLYTGTIEQRRRPDLVSGEDMWECPDFFALGDRHVLLASLIAFPQKSYYTRVAYYTGHYADRKFSFERMGDTDLGWAYASKTMLDANGRRIYWGWIRERRGKEAVVAAGWSGVMSLPRVLTMRDNGELGIAPLPELQSLRAGHTRVAATDVTGEAPLLKDVRGDSLEIIVDFDRETAEECGLRVRCSADGARSYRIPISGQAHVFIDASVIEVFQNGTSAMADRYYPEDRTDIGVALYSKGGTARLKTMDAWQVKSISKDRLTT